MISWDRGREKTLLAGWLLAAWSPFTYGWAAWLSGSALMLADLLRRSSELAVLFAAWYLYRWARRQELSPASFLRYERRVNGVLAAVMLVSAAVILVQVWYRWQQPQEVTRVTAGIVLASLGVLVNGWFWWKHQRYAREKASLLSESQYRLFRSKTVLDAFVIVNLSLTTALREYDWALYIDPLGSLVPALLLVVSALQIAAAGQQRNGGRNSEGMD